MKQYASRSAADYLQPGSHLKRFSDFLQRDDAGDSSNCDVDFAVLYDFQKAQPRFELQCPSDLESVTEDNSTSSGQSQLLLLRGYPSPEWLSAIGARFDVDPEFFEHHLRLDSSRGVQAANTWPLLSSAAVKEPRLRFTTLGYLQNLDEKVREASHVRKLRARATEVFGSYLRAVSNRRVKRGDSLLRGIRVHDAFNFSFEQDVSMWTRQTDKGWIGKLAFDLLLMCVDQSLQQSRGLTSGATISQTTT